LKGASRSRFHAGRQDTAEKRWAQNRKKIKHLPVLIRELLKLPLWERVQGMGKEERRPGNTKKRAHTARNVRGCPPHQEHPPKDKAYKRGPPINASGGKARLDKKTNVGKTYTGG